MQTIIPVRKPSKKQFVRVHSNPEFRAENMPTIEDETTGEIYLLAANLEFPVDVENKVDFLNLAAAITTEGSVFLWHYKNSTNSWSDSARIAVRQASRGWVRVIPDKSSNGYILEAPMVPPVDPVWPELSFTDMLENRVWFPLHRLAQAPADQEAARGFPCLAHLSTTSWTTSLRSSCLTPSS